MSLVEERDKWREEFANNTYEPIYYLEKYRENRNSNMWRSTREFERFCEYALYLEDELLKYALGGLSYERD